MPSKVCAPEIKENIVCNIEVRETFISKVGTIAGCYVLDGKAQRNTNCVIRDGLLFIPES